MKMCNSIKKKCQLPNEFSSYEQAGEFWDTHNSTDYLQYMTLVDVDAHLECRHFEIDIDKKVVKALEKRAHLEHISVSKLANKLLMKELVAH